MVDSSTKVNPLKLAWMPGDNGVDGTWNCLVSKEALAFVNSGSKLEVSVSEDKCGLNGGGIFLAVSKFQSMSAKNGCSFNSLASFSEPNLCFGFLFSKPLTKDLPSADSTSLGKRTLPKAMFLYICWVFSA
ncbi:hypothetical protein WICPIJ_003794 [Wickerhamomyces pijperi]|uniref:Uncharacterized protein n=1 Tax=Wickerhamomyces pijperi TaxID=599730 RepID=A0A9P8TNJ7_WICPI|nr:hypothetical protein WICPIJ_003794 [Wickerhamomyces pijperi]